VKAQDSYLPSSHTRASLVDKKGSLLGNRWFLGTAIKSWLRATPYPATYNWEEVRRMQTYWQRPKVTGETENRRKIERKRIMRTYYEKVLNGMRRPVLLVAVAIVALLSASGVAMGVNSTEDRNEGHAGKDAASDGLTTRAPATDAPATDTDFRTVQFILPSKGVTGRQRFEFDPVPAPNPCDPCRVDFSSPVQSAAVVLNGFGFNYLTSDSHTDVVEADVDFVKIGSAPNESDKVYIAFETQYHDKDTFSPYNGYVTATVIANVRWASLGVLQTP
jgi:hypothetical protein